MKLRLCCFIAALVTITSAAVDVEKTVLQVQSILTANTHLPRLSREEIIQLLNDIRAEDAKLKGASKPTAQKPAYDYTTPYSPYENEINPQSTTKRANAEPVTAPTVKTTTKSEPTVMVVLPYTPRDGSSLQELYTRPPKTEVLPESQVTPKPLSVKANEKLRETLKNNAKVANKQKIDIPGELQAFLDSHGLKGKPGQDHFLLPLEGFKPLPPAKVVDGNVELPENILLTYDLIAPTDANQAADNSPVQTSNSYLYEPLKPEIPFELETSSSESKKNVLPLDMPKRKVRPSYDPIDYDTVKVIPLNKGPSPFDDSSEQATNELGKRQANVTVQTVITNAEETTTVANDEKSAITNAPADTDVSNSGTDAGASIADLEDSFGGAAPAEPGDAQLPPPKKNGFYWMLDWNSFLEVGDGDTKVNIRFEPKLGDPQMFIPVSVP